MLNIKNEGIILEKSENAHENRAVLNPACLEKNGSLHMFYRAVRQDMVSTIGYCRFENGQLVERAAQPVLAPEHDYERCGLEDPRLVEFEGLYYLFYTAYDGKNARIAYATSPDLKVFTKHGLISPSLTYDEAEDLYRQSGVRDKYIFFEAYFKDVTDRNVLLWEKDAFIFPRRLNGRLAMVHRILPGIQAIPFDDFLQLADVDFWRSYLKELNQHIILDSEHRFENRNIGGGCPPIETPDGWLMIYHAVEDRPRGRVYHAAAALLDLNDPTKLIGRLPKPLFSPEAEPELHGDVNNVVFPTSAMVRGDRLVIYYGAADTCIMAKSIDLQELLEALKRSSTIARRPFSIDSMQQRIVKPWGEEIIYTPSYAETTGKLLKVKAGNKLSFQYHDQKQETMMLQSGKALLWIEDAQGEIQKVPMDPLRGYFVQPFQKHRIEALEDCVVLESSTPERGNTVRLDDDFGRPAETEQDRLSPDRGWSAPPQHQA
jgi:predicted GH43/DUF377 family glycosyl hydrolase/mannose-6-phosphate isomerase-like protein (cupin superfamily)